MNGSTRYRSAYLPVNSQMLCRVSYGTIFSMALYRSRGLLVMSQTRYPTALPCFGL